MRDLLEWASSFSTLPKIVVSLIVVLLALLILYMLWIHPAERLAPDSEIAGDTESHGAEPERSTQRPNLSTQAGGSALGPTANDQLESNGATRSPASDTTPPKLISFDLSPDQVDVREAPATVELRARLVDELSGIAGVDYPSSQTQVRFRSPSGRQFVTAMFLPGEHLVEGTKHHGEYCSGFQVQQFSEAGIWHLEYFLLVDQAGNSVSLNELDIEAMGFQNFFSVQA